MQSRFYAFAFALRGTRPVLRGRIVTHRVSEFVCRSCQRNFSTSPTLRWLGRSSKTAAKNVEKEKKYKSRLLIYDSGDARTTWITFWKAMALLEFGTTLVFGVPPLWKNENQPDPNVRKMQAVLVGVLGTIPTLTLAYFTAPFVHQVFLQIPEQARRSRHDLIRFARTLNANPQATANTKLEFVTLRIFPFRKTTTAFLHELRALPPRKLRLANIELPKTPEWVKRQREKGIFQRMFDVVNEPRFKFYVKEGRLYTMKTGVPGVWEEVAIRIQQQTITGKEEPEKTKTGAQKPTMVRKPVQLVTPAEKQVIQRQTTRQLRR